MAATTKGLFARGFGIDTTNYVLDGLFGRGFQGDAVVVVEVGKYAPQHARAYAQIKAAADASYSDAHARARAQILKAGV